MPNNKNLEKIIDELCENLGYAWNYYFTLEALHEQAKSDATIIDNYSDFFSSLYYSLFDSLFLRIAHFTDKSKNVVSLHYLFKEIKRYYHDDGEIKKWISKDRVPLNNSTLFGLKKIEDWRDKVVAHHSADVFLQDSNFFGENKLHLLEIRKILEFFEEMINRYSLRFLKRFNDTRLEKVKGDINKLFIVLRQGGIICRDSS